jgi:hypothetical protein
MEEDDLQAELRTEGEQTSVRSISEVVEEAGKDPDPK